MAKLINTSAFIKSKTARVFFPLIKPFFERICGFHFLNHQYETIKKQGIPSGSTFANEILKLENASIEFEPKLLEILTIAEQSDQAHILVANHPYGCIDSMAVMELAEETWPKRWKIIVNSLLRNVSEIADSVIVVDPFATGASKSANLSAVRKMHKFLKSKGLLVIFPAARVSGFDKEIDAVLDLPWNDSPLKLATQYGASIHFCHVSGQNSDTFLSISPKQLTKRSIRLAKEVAIQQNRNIKLSYSSTMNAKLAEKISKLSNSAEILRAHNYIGADRTPAQAPAQIEIKNKLHQNEQAPFHDALINSQQCMVEYPEFSSFCFLGSEEPFIMEEIGRQRELTYSAIGAGSGKTIDLSEEDTYYHHIVVTEKATGKLAGAYRVGFTNEILADHGSQGMYLDHIFEFEPSIYKDLGNAMELSRSFIPLEFQKSPQVLDILWKTLGKVSNLHKCENMYGSVTISDEFTPLSKSILVDTLDRHFSAPDSLKKKVSNNSPFKPTTQYHKLLSDAYAPHGMNRLNSVIEEIEEGHRGIPPLMRYYATLGAKFLSFKVEPTFNNAIYCLLVVDLSTLPTRYRKRFF